MSSLAFPCQIMMRHLAQHEDNHAIGHFMVFSIYIYNTSPNVDSSKIHGFVGSLCFVAQGRRIKFPGTSGAVCSRLSITPFVPLVQFNTFCLNCKIATAWFCNGGSTPNTVPWKRPFEEHCSITLKRFTMDCGYHLTDDIWQAELMRFSSIACKHP